MASKSDMSFDLFASRYWALRTLLETSYDGPSPIVDPDLPLVDPSLPATATAHLRGAGPACRRRSLQEQGRRADVGAWLRVVRRALASI